MAKKKVMVAEDDIDILEAVQMILEDAGYEVTTTVDGKTIQDVQNELPDIFLLDIWMTGMDGTSICHYLKSQKRTQHIPVILCSANKDMQRLAKECGADDFLAKPFEMNDLLDKVDKYV
jgi:CheY-like chemotaxis protein